MQCVMECHRALILCCVSRSSEYLIHHVGFLLAVDLLQKLSIGCKLLHHTHHTLDICIEYTDIHEAHTHAYTHTHTRVHAHTHTHKHTCTHAHTHAHTRTHTHTTQGVEHATNSLSSQTPYANC